MLNLRPSDLRKILTFFGIVLILFSTAAQQSDGCMAVVTDLGGDVEITRVNGKKVDAGWGIQLYKGDKIKTSKGSHVALLFENGNLINLGSASNIEIYAGKDDQANTGKPKQLSKAMKANFSALTRKQKKNLELGVIAGVRSINIAIPIELDSPCNTLIKDLRPSFKWESGKAIDEYLVKLYSSTGLVWQRKVTTDKLDYPEDEEGLIYGETYFWHVEGEVKPESYKSLNQEFSVLGPDKIEEVKMEEREIEEMFRGDLNSSSYHTLLGAYYLNIKLFEEAIEEFQIVSEINPLAALPHEILGKLYSNIGKKDRAISELQKALQLNKEE
jgi:hypothetical protein